MTDPDMPTARSLSTRRLIGMLLILELALIALFAYGIYRWTFEWRLNGPRVQAQVTNVEQRGDSYFVTYRYQVNGHEFVREHRVRRSYYEGVTPGQMIEIVYSPADTAISGIPGQGGGDFDLEHLPKVFFDLSMLVFALPATIMLLFLVIVALWIVARRQQRRRSDTQL
jgi:hypothetical protein